MFFSLHHGKKFALSEALPDRASTILYRCPLLLWAKILNLSMPCQKLTDPGAVVVVV